MVLKIAIVGGGIVGLSSAVRISEYFGNLAKVIIFTADSTPNTTGDVAAGIWTAYFIIGPENSKDKLLKWGMESFREWHRLWKCGNALESGICLVPLLHLTHKPRTMDDFCQDVIFGRERLTSKELRQLSIEHSENYGAGSRSVSFVCDVSRMLQYLTKRFNAFGGEIQMKKVTNFNELADDYDFIINCTGMGSRELANDHKLIPIRGQTIRVDAPWNLSCVINEAKEIQIAPNVDSFFIGGTSQYGDFNTNPNSTDFKRIRNESAVISKSLENTKILREKVGLRPARFAVRLDEESILSDQNKVVKVIHNYGHGGSGITLAWGCGGEVVSLIESNLYRNSEFKDILADHLRKKSEVKSKI